MRIAVMFELNPLECLRASRKSIQIGRVAFQDTMGTLEDWI